MTTIDMRKFVIMLALIGVAFALFPMLAADATPPPNQVSDWCNGEDGIKYEPVDTPFVVPPPPEGTTWTLIVLKAGTTNETVVNPVVGTAYSHSLHDNSHVILCWEELSDTTTTSTTTTVVVSTTLPATTTTDPTTTTSSSTTTTVPTTTTSTTLPKTTTTELPTTSTVPPTTTIPEVVTDLPNTGSNLTIFAVIGMALLLTGALILGMARSQTDG